MPLEQPKRRGRGPKEEEEKKVKKVVLSVPELDCKLEQTDAQILLEFSELEKLSEKRNKTMTEKSTMKKIKDRLKELKQQRDDFQRQRDILTPLHEKCPQNSIFRKHWEQKMKADELGTQAQ